MKKLLLALFAIVALAPQAGADPRDDVRLCNQSFQLADPSLRELNLNRAPQIIAACTRSLKLSTKFQKPDITYNLRGHAYHAIGENDLAIADYTTVIGMGLQPGVRYGYQNRANAWMDKGDLDRATADLTVAIEMAPKLASLFYNRALLYMLRADFPKAMEDLNRALALNPGEIDAINSRGNLMLARREFDSALADFNEAIKRAPNLSRSYISRADFWRQKGDLDRALVDLDKAISLSADKSESRAFHVRGEIRRYRGELDLALSDFNEALRVYPRYPPTLVGRGLAYEKMGDTAKARLDFAQALKLDNLPHAVEIDAVPARQTAQARLAAYDTGETQPTIVPAPVRVTNENSVPTPAAQVIVTERPPAPGRLAQPKGRRVALVIGNSAYTKVPALTNPNKDANAVAASLRKIGFDLVSMVSDANREKLIDALRNFANDAEAAEWAMVYYAGHGMEVNGINYIIPTDARLSADRDIQFEAVPLDQVLAALDGAKKLKLVVLDACRDNPFAPQMRKTVTSEVAPRSSNTISLVGTRTIGRGLGEVKVTGASLVVFAAKHGQTALDGEGANSPFAIALVQRISTPGVEINKVFRLVRDDVMEATAGRQEPYTYGSLPGREDFYFVASR